MSEVYIYLYYILYILYMTDINVGENMLKKGTINV